MHEVAIEFLGISRGNDVTDTFTLCLSLPYSLFPASPFSHTERVLQVLARIVVSIR